MGTGITNNLGLTRHLGDGFYEDSGSFLVFLLFG
jgi:hypothetical protein